mgnify:CR=1 FL=1
MKLGICIPYRDTGDGVRKGHLDTLVPYLEEFFKERNIDFRIYIGHQVDKKQFNRSGTKNVAFLAAKEDGCDYVAFHDVDMLPADDVDYSYPGETPKQIATYLSQWDYTLRDVEYFGGVVLFTIEQFEAVNGYHTNYWGWGMEDDDLFWRCYLKGYFKPELVPGPGHKKVLEFDGHTTYIEIPPSTTLNEVPTKSFKVEMLVKGEVKTDEEEYLIGGDNSQFIKYPILCKQGWDFDIAYNNSRAYSSSLWSWKNEHMYSWVKRYSDLWSKVNLEVNVRKGYRKLYINDVEYGEKFGIQQTEQPLVDRLKRYPPKPFYIGRNAPNSWGSMRNFFKGELAYIKIYNHQSKLVLHYDFDKSYKGNKVLDLSGYDNHGKLFLYEGKVKKVDISQLMNTLVPDRRYGTMECMPHEDEGIVDNKFTDIKSTARNEMIYRKHMQKGEIDVDKDEYGLHQMKCEIVNKDDIYNRHQIVNVRF